MPTPTTAYALATRIVSRTLLAGILTVLLDAARAGAQPVTRGGVFHDKNANGLLDKGEPGIPGVSDSFSTPQPSSHLWEY